MIALHLGLCRLGGRPNFDLNLNIQLPVIYVFLFLVLCLMLTVLDTITSDNNNIMIQDYMAIVKVMYHNSMMVFDAAFLVASLTLGGTLYFHALIELTP